MVPEGVRSRPKSRPETAKRGRVLGVLYAVFFGGFTAFVIWSDWANRLFAKPLDVLCAPVRLLLGVFFGTSDYLGWYFALSIIFMAGLGYALGYALNGIAGRGRRRSARPQPPFSLTSARR